jgi:beta-phosphoglucomutase-like phosphatase (HAD superfamily)
MKLNKLTGIQLVTFDMDGTLIDDEWAHEQAKTEIAHSIGAYGDLDLPQFTGRSNRKFWKHILDKFNLTGDIEELTARQFNRVLELCIENKQPESYGLTEAVRYFKTKGIKVAITSGSDEYFVDEMLSFLGLTPFFDVKVSKEQVKEVKPSPDIYLRVQEFSGIAGNCAVGIEDSNSGCSALHAAGMRCIGYTNSGANPQSLEQADIRIATMLELIDLIDV